MSVFQPDHKGRHPQVRADKVTVAHSADRTHINEHNGTHGYDGGKPPKPKHGGGVTAVHGGMHRVVNGNPVTGGGSHTPTHLGMRNHLADACRYGLRFDLTPAFSTRRRWVA